MGRATYDTALFPAQHQLYSLVLFQLIIYIIVVHPSLISVIEPTPFQSHFFLFCIFLALLISLYYITNTQIHLIFNILS